MKIYTIIFITTYFISQYVYTSTHFHLEMFFRIYKPYYIMLPNAIIGSIGFILICRGITNPILAKPVEMNLALLPFHQVLAFPLFRHVFFNNWWKEVYLLPASDPRYILFACTLTLFSVALIAVIHFAIKYSPFSIIVNQPLASFYHSKKAPSQA